MKVWPDQDASGVQHFPVDAEDRKRIKVGVSDDLSKFELTIGHIDYLNLPLFASAPEDAQAESH